MTELEEAELADGQRHRRRQLGWFRPAADEILSMVQLEEDARDHELQVEREEQERRKQLEQARIDRLSMKLLRCDVRWTSALTSMS